MSTQQSWSLQQAIYSRLAAQLAGKGPDGADVPVYDHVPASPPRLHARIDGFGTYQRPIKCDSTRHSFTVHVFDRPTIETGAARGQKTTKLLQQVIVSALHRWEPGVVGASAIRHDESYVAPDEDGLTQHGYSRFTLLISES